MSKGKKNYHGHACYHFFLNSDDGQDWGKEAECAHSGKNAVPQTQGQSAQAAAKLEFMKKIARQRALRHSHHAQGNPDQDGSDDNLPVSANISQNSSQGSTDCSDNGNGYKESQGKKQGVGPGFP